jgi:lipid II:glycine glycyltransferase (peptidoglycan interpeptide bridge formation enzyme)
VERACGGGDGPPGTRVADAVTGPASAPGSAPLITVARAQPGDRSAWDAFIAATPAADHLQAWGWGEVTAVSGERPVRLIARNPAGAVRGVAQVLVRDAAFGRRVLYAPHGPVFDAEAGDGGLVLDALLAGIRELGRAERGIVAKLDPRAAGHGARTGETRLRDALLARGLRPARADLQARTTRVLDLAQGSEALFAALEKDTRNLVRRATREGVTTRVLRDADRDAYASFAGILAATGRRSGFRVRSSEALLRLADEFAPRGGTYLVVAELGARMIAGCLAVRVGGRASYLYAASLRDEALRHANGAYAALWALCEALVADGAESLDLWGVAEPGDSTADPDWRGFSLFKLGFGGVPLRHPGTFDLVLSPGWYAVRDLRERVGR